MKSTAQLQQQTTTTQEQLMKQLQQREYAIAITEINALPKDRTIYERKGPIFFRCTRTNALEILNGKFSFYDALSFYFIPLLYISSCDNINNVSFLMNHQIININLQFYY
jgi:hypothetical protein